MTMTTQARAADTPAALAVDDIAAALEPGRPRIVVLGGGVAGLTAAYELHRRLGAAVQLTLVSNSEQFSLGPALLWVPFGQRTGMAGFSLPGRLDRSGIAFVRALVERINPERRVVAATYQGRTTELPYDYLIIATGPRADGTAIPGVAGEFDATTSLWSETSAVDTRHALEGFLDLEQPGPVVVGLAPGASYLSAAYEFVLTLDHELRRRGTRARASLTFVTPEPYLGHLDVGGTAARRRLERLFARRHIVALTGAEIARVDRTGVHLRDGRVLPAAYTLIMPPFTGVTGIWKSPGLTDEHGFVPVDARYRHGRYPEIYAAGVAARLSGPAGAAPAQASALHTGYLSAAMAKAAARNVAAAITGCAPAARSLPRLRDLRLLDGGDGGLLLAMADLGRPRQVAVPLPGRTAHWAKRALTRYLLWKLRTGRTHLP